MLTRTRSKTLSPTVPADSTSEDELPSSQSQSASDAFALSPADSEAAMADAPDSEPAAAALADPIAAEAAAAAIHIHCPTTVRESSASAPDECEGGATSRWNEAAARVAVHVLPCCIHYNGPAAVESYFQPSPAHNPTLPPAAAATRSATPNTATYVSDSAPPVDSLDLSHSAPADSRWSTAAFRGRLLTGERIVLPPHTIGLVVRDSGGIGSGGGSRGGGGSTKRHRAVRAQATKLTSTLSSAGADDECVVVDESSGGSRAEAVADSRQESAARIDWLVDGWFDAVTLWGRDSDWKGADQCAVKRTLLEWPAIAAALHDIADAADGAG